MGVKIVPNLNNIASNNSGDYNSAIDEEMMDPGSKYNLPGYNGLVLQSYPPKIQFGSGDYVSLQEDARGDWTYPTERPGYDPASGMTVPQYNNHYEQRFPYGDPGMVIPNVWGKGQEATSPVLDGIRANRNAMPTPGVTSIPLDRQQLGPLAIPMQVNPFKGGVQVVSQPPGGAMVQSGTLDGSGNFSPSSLNDYWDSLERFPFPSLDVSF